MSLSFKSKFYYKKIVSEFEAATFFAFGPRNKGKETRRVFVISSDGVFKLNAN